MKFALAICMLALVVVANCEEQDGPLCTKELKAAAVEGMMACTSAPAPEICMLKQAEEYKDKTVWVEILKGCSQTDDKERFICTHGNFVKICPATASKIPKDIGAKKN